MLVLITDDIFMHLDQVGLGQVRSGQPVGVLLAIHCIALEICKIMKIKARRVEHSFAKFKNQLGSQQ